MRFINEVTATVVLIVLEHVLKFNLHRSHRTFTSHANFLNFFFVFIHFREFCSTKVRSHLVHISKFVPGLQLHHFANMCARQPATP